MYRLRVRVPLLLAVAFLLTTDHWPLTTAQAAKVKVWHHYAPAHYDKAKLKQAVVSNEGALRLAHQLKPLTGLDAMHVWNVIEDKDGNLYVATGEDGKLYKVTTEGKVSVVFASEDSQVLCLAQSSDGSVYAGTGPGGHIVRIDPKGAAKVIYDSPESYVWSLAVDGDGQTIYAATGPKGRIYRVTPEGKGSVFYTTKQEHVLCLALGSDGTLYAGTDKGGLVYRIDPKGKGFVLYQAPQTEVRSLIVTQEAVYAGTSAPTRRRGTTGSSAGGSSTAPIITVVPAPKPKEKESTSTESALPPVSSTVAPSDSKEPVKPTAAAPPSLGENSVYRIAHDGTVREIFREKAMVLCLLRQNGRTLAGTGMEGQLFEVDETSKERSEIARLDHGQILVHVQTSRRLHRARHRRPRQALRVARQVCPARHGRLRGARRQDHQQVGRHALEGQRAGGHDRQRGRPNRQPGRAG